MSGGRPAPAWTVAMRRLLSDGQWHSLETVIRTGAARVPPEVAAHTYRVQLAGQRKNVQPEKNRAQTTSDKVRTGRYYLCRRIIQQWARRGFVEIDPPGWRATGKRVRTLRNWGDLG